MSVVDKDVLVRLSGEGRRRRHGSGRGTWRAGVVYVTVHGVAEVAWWWAGSWWRRGRRRRTWVEVMMD